MRLRFVLFAASLVAAPFTAAYADPVTYTLQGTFSGSLGVQTFSSVAGTLTFQGDSSGTTSLGSGFYTNVSGISTITLSGIGTAIFLSPTFGVESQPDGAAFYDTGNGFGVSIYDPALGAYALGAPFSDTGYLERSFAATYGATALTNLGELALDGDDNTSAQFTASQTVPSAVTPEPGSLPLLVTGVLGVAGVLRKRIA